MAIANYSVPQDVKEAFDSAFSRRNKSAVIAGLMRRAVEEEALVRRRARAVRKLLRLRAAGTPVTERQARDARRSGRP